MKGNDGKGARKVLAKKVAAILLPFFLLISMISFLRSSKTTVDSRSQRYERRKDGRGSHMYREDGFREEMHHMHDMHDRHDRRDGHDRRDMRDRRDMHDRRDRHQRREMFEPEDFNEEILDADIEKLLRKQHLSESEKEKLILSGSVNLINVSGHNLERAVGRFCRLNWNAQKTDPAKVPMFRDLIEKSPHCARNAFEFNLKEAVELTRAYDENGDGSNVHTLEPNGFVFHESRCGSTLVANSLAAMSPAHTRVYSESGPPLSVLQSCGDDFGSCRKEEVAGFFQDVIYMMGRTDNPDEKYMFFKIQSAGSKFISVLNSAFPDAPWIFVYRDPVEVMMSHLDIPKIERANCLRSMRRPTKAIRKMVEDKGESLRDLSQEDFCAVHLATLCQSALDEYHSTGKGEFVNYVDLPNLLIDYIIPDHFNVPIGPEEAQNIHEVSTVYSKGSHNRDKEWKEDSQKKHDNANKAILRASETWLLPLFNSMEKGEGQ